MEPGERGEDIMTCQTQIQEVIARKDELMTLASAKAYGLTMPPAYSSVTCFIRIAEEVHQVEIFRDGTVRSIEVIS
jgi:hypothetical protein